MKYYIIINEISEILELVYTVEDDIQPFFNKKLEISKEIYQNIIKHKEMFLLPEMDEHIEIENYKQLFKMGVSLILSNKKNDDEESILGMKILDYGTGKASMF
jgi:hypothetical protein